MYGEKRAAYAAMLGFPDMRLAGHKGLMQLALSPTLAADIKMVAEQALIARMETISLGERVALSRRASARVAAALLLDTDARVSEEIVHQHVRQRQGHHRSRIPRQHGHGVRQVGRGYDVPRVLGEQSQPLVKLPRIQQGSLAIQEILDLLAADPRGHGALS